MSYEENMKRIILLIVVLMMSVSCGLLYEKQNDGSECFRTINGSTECLYLH